MDKKLLNQKIALYKDAYGNRAMILLLEMLKMVFSDLEFISGNDVYRNIYWDLNDYVAEIPCTQELRFHKYFDGMGSALKKITGRCEKNDKRRLYNLNDDFCLVRQIILQKNDGSHILGFQVIHGSCFKGIFVFETIGQEGVVAMSDTREFSFLEKIVAKLLYRGE